MKTFIAVVLSFCLLSAPSMVRSAEEKPSFGSNRELMKEWNSNKMLVNQKIYEKLKEEGRLPKDGAIRYEAHIKADPHRKGKVQIRVDNIQVMERVGEASGKESCPDPGDRKKVKASTLRRSVSIPEVEMRDIPLSGSVVIMDYVELRDIELPGSSKIAGTPVAPAVSTESAAPPAPPQSGQTLEQPKQAPESPAEKTWWQRLFGG